MSERMSEQGRRIEPADGLHRTAPYAEPDLTMEYDEDGEPLVETRSVGWDVSFGCRINFGHDPRTRSASVEQDRGDREDHLSGLGGDSDG